MRINLLGLLCLCVALTPGLARAGQVGAQTPTQSPVQTEPRSGDTSDPLGQRTKTKAQLTLSGCVQRESDFLHGGEGVHGNPSSGDDEFVLTSAVISVPAHEGKPVGTTGTTATYELTGKHERELKANVGKRVEVVGMLKDDKLDVTSFKSVPGTCR